MKCHHISKTKTGQIIDHICQSWGFDVTRPRNLIQYEIDSDARLLDTADARILVLGETHIPFLSDVNLLSRFPKMTVDAGAIRFVCNGADIMRPGVTSYDQFREGQIICVAEPGNKYLAVGRATIDSSKMDDIKKGVVAKSLHYISDKYWEAIKDIH